MNMGSVNREVAADGHAAIRIRLSLAVPESSRFAIIVYHTSKA